MLCTDNLALGMASTGGRTPLSLRHGFRCVAEASVTVEDVLLAVGEQIGYENIFSASRMNKAVVVFLNAEVLVNKVIENGLWVKGLLTTTTPLFAPATKVIISNVPPFIENDVIVRELARFGKVVSEVKAVSLRCKNPALKHVVSFRRHVFMFLNSPEKVLDVSFRVKDGDSSYMIFASTESLRCFECGDYGHKRLSCPQKKTLEEPRTSAETEETVVHKDVEVNQKPGEEKSGSEEGPVAETSKNNGLEVSGDVVSNLNNVDNEKPSCSSVNGTAVVKEQLVDGHVGLHVSEVLCASMEDEEEDFMTQSQDDMKDDESLSDLSDLYKADDDLYSVEQINAFLDETKGKKVEIGDFFPDKERFVASVVWARKTYNHTVLSQQKRYRLKKYITTIRHDKKGVTVNERRFRDKAK